MGAHSKIEWTDAAWNPVRGCSLISPGCENCYAERIAGRFSGPGGAFDGFAAMTPRGPRWTGRVELLDDAKLLEPLGWKVPRRVFVNSTSDLFHEALPFAAIASVFGTMALAHRHVFQILTKRAPLMRRYLSGQLSGSGRRSLRDIVEQQAAGTPGLTWPLPNVWLGVSVEDQKRAEDRIPDLLATPAVVRFISYEPALGPIDLTPWLKDWSRASRWVGDGGPPWSTIHADKSALAGDELGRRGIHWIIVGGESGPGARPFDVAWARSLIRQCRAASVSCFVKQLGRVVVDYGTPALPWPPSVRLERLQDGGKHVRLRDLKGGDMDECPRTSAYASSRGGSMATEARPFLKWAGGKTAILSELRRRLPERWYRYHEPFLGGGALFFDLANAGRLSGGAILSDINTELIDTYRVVRDSVDDLISVLRRHVNDPEHFYAVRSQDPSALCLVERAARLIYLNKTCFNGLYRVNKRGQFNVPFGRYAHPTICDVYNLYACSLALADVTLATRSYACGLGIQRGDFVYFDPPYAPSSPTASFTAYATAGFGSVDQKHLRDHALQLARNGVHILLSNADTPEVRALYSDNFTVDSIVAPRAMRSKAPAKKRVPELLIRPEEPRAVGDPPTEAIVVPIAPDPRPCVRCGCPPV